MIIDHSNLHLAINKFYSGQPFKNAPLDHTLAQPSIHLIKLAYRHLFWPAGWRPIDIPAGHRLATGHSLNGLLFPSTAAVNLYGR
jgi:hypothetical protein